MRRALYIPAIFVIALATKPARAADSTAVDTSLYTQHPQKIAHAVRVETAPVVDGQLEDEAWLLAPVQTGFTQRDPDPGKPASERTEFRIVYDDEAIYIGAMCFDREPDKITSMLARRDDWESRDNFNINLDPHHDHKRAISLLSGHRGGWGMASSSMKTTTTTRGTASGRRRRPFSTTAGASR
jgi:hypothetical protein